MTSLDFMNKLGVNKSHEIFQNNPSDSFTRIHPCQLEFYTVTEQQLEFMAVVLNYAPGAHVCGIDEMFNWKDGCRVPSCASL